MPRFYFDIDDGVTSMRDEEGSELADLASAEREATETLVQMARDTFGPAHRGSMSVSIRDGTEEVLRFVQLRLTVKEGRRYENIPTGDDG